MTGLIQVLATFAVAVSTANAAALASYNVDPATVSVSGLSAGGFMAAQLGVAYSGTFKTGFGVFAGGPFDCARSQAYFTCMNNQNPSISQPTSNMKAWDGKQIDPLSNLAARQIYMEVGRADTVVGPNPMAQLKAQLTSFDSTPNVSYVTTNGAAHTFPTNFDGAGDNACGSSTSPYISDCQYDGAGAVLKWMYGSGLNAPNTGAATGSVVSFSQTGSYGSAGMDNTGYLYVPKSCQSGSTVCRLHVALHGCLQSYSSIQMKYITNTGYNEWADTNDIIILYPQGVPDYTLHTIAAGTQLSNPNGCFDWVGWYGANFDQHGGVQMVAMVNMVNHITSGYKGGSTPPPQSTQTSQPTQTATGSAPATTTTPGAPLYGQCGGKGWTGPTTCQQGVCTAYSDKYAQCLLPTR